MEINALHRLRSAQGIIGLADRHDPARLNAACRMAIDVGDPTYRTVKGILAAGTEHHEPAAPAATTGPAHLHGPAPALQPRQREVASMTRRHQLETTLRTLKLSGMLDTLDARLAQAQPATSATSSSSRHSAKTKSPAVKPPPSTAASAPPASKQPSHPRGLRLRLQPEDPRRHHPRPRHAALLRADESVILHGPVGVGKTHIAQALGHHACRHGHRHVHQDQPPPRRPRRRPRRPHLGHPPAPLDQTRRPHPRRLRDARIHSAPSRRPLRTHHRTRRHGSLIVTSNRHPKTGTHCSRTLSSPNPSSTVSSTPPTTSTCTDAATDPVNRPKEDPTT